MGHPAPRPKPDLFTDGRRTRRRRRYDALQANKSTWEAEVRELYAHSLNMEVDEFERLLTQAIEHPDERPSHPDLPIVLPFETASELR